VGTAAVGTGDDDLVAEFQRLEMAEDTIRAVPGQVSSQHGRPDLTWRRTFGEPPDRRRT
jgi:hypothetical protein